MNLKLIDMITKDIWQSGEYRKLPEFATQESYYKEIQKFINEYGKPTTKDMLLVRSGKKEEESGNYGASWTTNINVCRKWTKYTNFSDTIYLTYVPANTMAVYIPAKGTFEEEYVLDMEGKKEQVEIIAKHSGEWDFTSDFETDVDFYNWKLFPSKKIYTDIYKNNPKLFLTLVNTLFKKL